MYYEQTGDSLSQATLKRRELGTIPQQLKGQPKQDALCRGYKRQLEDLKTKYYASHLQTKAVQPRKLRAPRAPGQRRRLSPIIL